MDKGFAFIKMSAKWYCVPIESEWDYREKWEDNFQHHIANGNVIALAETVDGFAHEMGVEEDDIVMVDDDDDDGT